MVPKRIWEWMVEERARTRMGMVPISLENDQLKNYIALSEIGNLNKSYGFDKKQNEQTKMPK